MKYLKKIFDATKNMAGYCKRLFLPDKELDLTEEQIAQLAVVFRTYDGHPLAYAWEKIFEQAYLSCLWELSHLSKDMPPADRPLKLEFISGQLKQIELFRAIPKDYAKHADDLDKEKK